jgi:hypothetical protein
MRFRIIVVTGDMDICFKIVTNPFYVRSQIRLRRKDTYLQELVRYIHLNPLRAKIVKTLTDSDKYPYSGHSALMGKIKRDFQDTDYTLVWRKGFSSAQSLPGLCQKGYFPRSPAGVGWRWSDSQCRWLVGDQNDAQSAGSYEK